MCPNQSLQGETFPQGTGFLDRPRLLQRLQGAFQNRLTLITAPPGFGKTTLITQAVRGISVPVAWQTIDERSRDLPNLYHQALSALGTVFPTITQLAPPYGYGPGELATLIGDYLSENLSTDLLYILDDTHQIAGAALAETWLRNLVTAVPPSCHLIIASRMLPRLPLAEMIARGEVIAIGQEDLRFTTDEIKELGTVLLGTPHLDDSIQQLVDRLEGWPAGTILAFRPLSPELEQLAVTEPEQIVPGRQGGPEALFDKLARLMLQAQPRNVRNFLLASSTLARLTPETCTEALGLSNTAEMLREIQTRNLYVSKVSGALVYHTLFRNFLQAELETSDPELFIDLHGRAAGWFMDNDLPADAFDHYIQARQPTDAATLAERMAVAYFAQNRVETLLTWNTQLRNCTTSAPRLAYYSAIIYIDNYDYDAAEERLREAERTYQPDQTDFSLDMIRIQYSHLNILRGNYRAAIDYVFDLAENDPEPTNIRGRALNLLGRAAFQMGHVEESVRQLEAALELYRDYENKYALAQHLQGLVAAYWRLGRLQEALAALHEVVALQRSLGGAGPLALALNSLGYCCHHLGDYKHAVEALQEGLTAITRFPNRRAESYLAFNLADVRRDQSQIKEAFELYDDALNAVGDSEPSLKCTILCGMATAYRWQGDLTEAKSAAQEADRLARKQNIGNEGRLARAALWAAEAQSGDPMRALNELQAVVAELEEHQEQFALLPTLGLCANVALLTNQPDLAVRYLDNSIQLAAKLGTSAPIAIEIVHMPVVDALIREKGEKFSDLIHIVDELRAVQSDPANELTPTGERVSDVTYSLQIITLGQVRVIRHRKTIATADWRPAARDLFLYLVFCGQATRDEICLSFWPDSPTKRARDNFHTTMYRIRETLGENIVKLDDEGNYRINPDISIWCDATELEALASDARLFPKTGARTEELWRRAVSHYNGEFLPSLDFPWVVTYRERLRELFLEALVGLGDCARARGDYREAIDTFNRALEHDPYREDIHRAIIDYHLDRGSKPKAIAQFNKLKTLLRKDLGIAPSTETLQLTRRLFA